MESQHLNTPQFQTSFLVTQNLASKEERNKVHSTSIYDPETQVSKSHCTLYVLSCHQAVSLPISNVRLYFFIYIIS